WYTPGDVACIGVDRNQFTPRRSRAGVLGLGLPEAAAFRRDLAVEGPASSRGGGRLFLRVAAASSAASAPPASGISGVDAFASPPASNSSRCIGINGF